MLRNVGQNDTPVNGVASLLYLRVELRVVEIPVTKSESVLSSCWPVRVNRSFGQFLSDTTRPSQSHYLHSQLVLKPGWVNARPRSR